MKFLGVKQQHMRGSFKENLSKDLPIMHLTEYALILLYNFKINIANKMFFWSLYSYIVIFRAFLPLLSVWTEDLYQAEVLNFFYFLSFLSFFQSSLTIFTSLVLPLSLNHPAPSLDMFHVGWVSVKHQLSRWRHEEQKSVGTLHFWPLPHLPQRWCVVLSQDLIPTCACWHPTVCSI